MRVGTANSGGKAIAEVQPCGFAVVLGEDWRVAAVSDSIADHFADCAPFMVGQPLAEHFGAAAVHSLRNQLALLRDPSGSARLFSVFLASVPKPFDAAMHLADASIVLELLPSAHVEAGDPAGTVRQMAAQLDSCASAAELLQRGARSLRALTGFDCVTIFKDSQAVSHDARGDFQPARHCPPAALRMVADAARAPTMMVPDCDAALLDRALLRCPDEAERDAIRQEGASAILAVPLRSAGRDWGMAVARSRNAQRPALDRIVAAELFGEMLAMRAELLELRARL
jgi:GAF domain-containing protein